MHGLQRDSPSTSYGSRGVAVEGGGRPRATAYPVSASGTGGVGMAPPGEGQHRRQDLVRYPVQAQLSPLKPGPPEAAAPGGAPAAAVPVAAPTATTVPAVEAGPARATHGETHAPRTSAVEAYTDRPSLARESKEMLPGTFDMPAPGQVEKARVSADNTGGYGYGTGARGVGSGGTTEAMTGGIASGGAIGDERRSGMGDLARGSMS